MPQNDKEKLRSILRNLEDTASISKEESQLSEFWNDLTGGYAFKSPDDWFDALAHYLMNYLCLSVADEMYRITEIEIYYYDKENHPDPYVHCAKEQLSVGDWYFNGSGLDITFGNAEKGIFGGILIRGMMKFSESPYFISGPSNVLKEIFSNIGNILFDEGGLSLMALDQETIKRIEMEPVRSTRIGLTRKNDDHENFIDKNYRFLVDLSVEHKFKDKEKVIQQLLDKNEITLEKAKEILGYNMKL